jgi:hypothetical protein
MKLPQEISEKFIKANSLYELRERFLVMPFCFNKCKKLSKEIYVLKKEGWEMVYDIYPELKGKKISIDSLKNEIKVLPNDPTTVATRH